MTRGEQAKMTNNIGDGEEIQIPVVINAEVTVISWGVLKIKAKAAISGGRGAGQVYSRVAIRELS
jgi:hypothetical protein